MHDATATPGPEDARREALARTHLDALGIAYTVHRHPPVATVEAARAARGELEGAHVKNLFLTDKRKSRFWLVTALEETRVDLKALRDALDARSGLRFAAAEQLAALLDLEPGAVTPLGVLADRDGRVTVVLDARLREHARVNVHPLHNAATLGLAVDDLERALIAADHRPWWMTLPEAR